MLLDFEDKDISFNLYIGLDNTLDEIINILTINNKINIFTYYLREGFLPKEILDKYNYLLNAKNFDIL